jgi:hypothetical protein
MDFAGFNGKQGVIPAFFDAGTGMKFAAALADQNGAGFGDFTFIQFYAEAFGNGISAKLSGALGFTMCHIFRSEFTRMLTRLIGGQARINAK